MHILEYLFNTSFSRITIYLKREYFILSVTFHQQENTEMPSPHFQATTDSTDFSKRQMKDFIWKCASYFQILNFLSYAMQLSSSDTDFPFKLRVSYGHSQR